MSFLLIFTLSPPALRMRRSLDNIHVEQRTFIVVSYTYIKHIIRIALIYDRVNFVTRFI